MTLELEQTPEKERYAVISLSRFDNC